MENKVIAIKAAIASTVAAITMALGWRGILLVAWVIAMVLDYISGSMAARKMGQWESKKAREGIWHKLGMIVVVITVVIADTVLMVVCANMPGIGISWPVVIFPVIVAWYIVTELGSVLENAVEMGANVPAWLVKGLKVAQDKINDAVIVEKRTE